MICAMTDAPVTPLMQHQAAAVAKLHRSRVGALFMEMGTGKSRTAIEIAAQRRDRISRVLWFCPVSVKETIRREIEKHWPGQTVHVFDHKTCEGKMPEARWYVIGLESMSASVRVIVAAESLIDANAMVIVDESSYIKGHRARRTTYVTKIAARARYRLILTGTPISQGVVDLFAQMRFLSTKILGYKSFHSFAANHLEYHEKFPGMIVRAHNTDWLAAKMAPYVYQVTKEECLNLPDKLYTTRYCTLTPEQREAYERAKDEMLQEYLDNEGEVTAATIFRLFNALQCIVSGWWNRKSEKDEEAELLEFPHNRLELLDSVLGEIPEGEKVIIWTKHRRSLAQIEASLGASVAVFHGGLSESERTRQLDSFRSSRRYLVATPDCGGHGLNLTEASYAVYYDNQFKFANRLQSEDRCHRIGQARKVTYIDLHCSGTIDDRIQNCLAKKGDVVNEFRAEIQRMRDKKTIIQAIKAL